LSSQERALERVLTGPLSPERSAVIPEREGKSREGVGVPDELAPHGTLLVRLSLSPIEG
jgi:hypothetical protein